MKKLLLLSITTLALISGLIGQSNPYPVSNTKIYGLVVDDASGKPIEYATIALRSKVDSTIVTGTISNEMGYFVLERVRPGRYDVEVSFIGFTKFIIRDVRLGPQRPEIDLGTIRLKPVTIDMDAVTVTGEKKPVEYTLDKKIVNIDDNLASMGATAADILATVPSVTVDVDGTVSLRGSSDVTILVDGKPSQIISLDEIPASMIEKIEIITNPSARYDPEGKVGIINIILKKKRSPGYNAVFNLNGGTRDRYNGSVNFNYRVNNVNLFVNYDNRFGRMSGGSIQKRSYTILDTLYYLNQSGDFRSKMQFHNLRLGLDYDFNKYNTLTIAGAFNIRSHDGQNFTDYTALNYQLDTTQFSTRSYLSERGNNGNEISLNYKRTYPQEGREWTADIFYSKDIGNDQSRGVQRYILSVPHLPDWYQNTYNDGIREAFTLRSDYVHPLSNISRFEAGFKSDYRLDDNDYRVLNKDPNTSQWEVDAASTNHFIYRQYINAIYGIYAGALGKFQYQAGLRLEHALCHTYLQNTNQKNTNSYFSYFPSGFLKYNFNEGHGIQLNYSRRIMRPFPRALNPFVDYTDPHNLFYGNPNLNPEYIDALELSNYFETRKGSIYANVYYRQADDMITRITRLDTVTGVTKTTFENLNSSKAYGLEITGDLRLTRWWRVNANWNLYHSEIRGPMITQKEARDITSWNARLMSMITPNRTTSFQIFFFYVAPSLSGSGPIAFGGPGGRGGGGGFRFMSGGGQGRTKSFYSVNLGLRKTFWDGKLILNLRVQDLFKPSSMSMTTYGDNFKTYARRWHDSRMLVVGLTYKINETDRMKKRRQPQEEQEYEFEEYYQ